MSKHHLYLRDLYDFLKENNKLVKEFGIPDCLLFLRELKRKKRPWYHVVSSVRAFVRYSCERNLLADCNFPAGIGFYAFIVPKILNYHHIIAGRK